MTRERGNAIASLLAFAVPLGVFAASAHRDVGYWDAGEMDTVPWMLGIAHPTGFPAYVLVGWLWSHAVPVGSVAFRMSLLSAAGVSVAAWSIGCIVRDEWPGDAWLGTACAWLFAFGTVAWMSATRAEVHALAIAALTLAIRYALRWYRDGAPRDAIAAGVACGIGIAVHPIVAAVVPGAIVLVAARRDARRAVALAALAGVGAAGIWFAYLPVRSAFVTAHGLDPTRALGLRPGMPFWDYDHPADAGGFAALVTGADFEPMRAIGELPASATLQARAGAFVPSAARELTWPAIACALAGAAVAWWRDRLRCIFLLACAAPAVPFALGFAAESDVERYFLTAFAVAAIFIGDALGAAARRWPAARDATVAAPLLVAAVLVLEQRALFAQPHDERARVMIQNVQAFTPPNAILVASWPYATPLAYAAYVDGVMGARVVVPRWVSDDGPQVAAWVRARPVYAIGAPAQRVPGLELERISTTEPLYRVTVK